MDEMDTISDFLSYFIAREKFLSNPNAVISATGEEQLIAAYISSSDETGHSFLPAFDGEAPDYVFFDESHYPSLKARPEYIEMRRVNAQSKLWDEIIEQFIRLGDPAIVHPYIGGTASRCCMLMGVARNFNSKKGQHLSASHSTIP